MNTADESWVARARAVPIQQEIERRHIKLHGAIDRCGPCPKCGGADRFSINTKKQCWNCRGCAGGGDVIGTGANGKSVFVSTVTGILADYAIVAPMETFIASKTDRHPTEIAKLLGARLVVAQETQKGRRWDEAKIKNLTGGDKLTGRFMRGDFFDFKPTHKLLISGNHKPSLSNVDDAIRRRFLLVPFTVQIPASERDPRLAEKLKAEWPAIFRWMIDGCLEWRRDGLMVPTVVRKATEEYLADNDVMAQWLEESIVDGGPAAFTATGELFGSWKRWCESRNYQPGTERAFSDSLSDCGYNRDRKKTARGFRGIALKQSSMLAEE